jgi:RHS repeat-associated protein
MVEKTGSTYVTTAYVSTPANEIDYLVKGGVTKDFTYDSNGNMRTKGSSSYQYDYKNMLVYVDTGTTTVSFTYDGDGRRIRKQTPSAVTNYLYDGANCVAETDANGDLKAIYAHGAELISKKDSSGILYYLYDHLGNTMATVSSSGTVVTRYSYDAFGAIRSESPSGDTKNKNKFVGVHGIVDDSDDDGLIYMRARFYDTEVGRFISRDPKGTSDGSNLYCYCSNNRASRKALYQLGS